MKNQNSQLTTGLIFLFVAIVGNLFAVLVLNQSAAQFFSDGWWSTWFPSWMLGIIFTSIGLGQLRSGKTE